MSREEAFSDERGCFEGSPSRRRTSSADGPLVGSAVMQQSTVLSRATCTSAAAWIARVLRLLWVQAGARMEELGGMFAPVNFGCSNGMTICINVSFKQLSTWVAVTVSFVFFFTHSLVIIDVLEFIHVQECSDCQEGSYIQYHQVFFQICKTRSIPIYLVNSLLLW